MDHEFESTNQQFFTIYFNGSVDAHLIKSKKHCVCEMKIFSFFVAVGFACSNSGYTPATNIRWDADDIRGSVTHQRNHLPRSCAISNKRNTQSAPLQVDHILECQLLAYWRVSNMMGQGKRGQL